MFEDMFSKLKSWWGVTFDGAQANATVSRAEYLDPAPVEEPVDPKANDPEPMGPDEAYAARNEVLSRKLGVYLDMNGYYEMTESALRDYGQSGLTDGQIQDGYSGALEACRAEIGELDPSQAGMATAVLEDMAMYNMAHDPTWLASLPASERKAAVERYLEFENGHTRTGEDGKEQVYFGVTAEEYAAMGETARAEYDAVVAACATSWGASFKRSFDEYVADPDVQDGIDKEKDPAEPKKKAGFWATLTASVSGVAASVKSMVENSEIGKKVVAWLDGMKEKLGFADAKSDPGLVQPIEDPQTEDPAVDDPMPAVVDREDIDVPAADEAQDDGMSL